MTEEQPPLKRVRLNDEAMMEMKREDLLHKWKQQDNYVDYLENSMAMHSGNDDIEEKLRQQQSEFTRKEKIQKLRLSTKEQEFQELANKLTEISKGQTPGANQLRSCLLDPALNLLFQRMKKELEDKSKQMQQAQEDMTAWKFTSDSQTGKRLMARCRTLLQENQDLGKQVSSGKIANLDAELAMQKKYNEEMKGSQDELYEMVLQLNEEGEGMQSTICALQQQLKEAQMKLANYKGEPSTDTNCTLTKLAPVEPPPTTDQENADKVNERTEDITESDKAGKTKINNQKYDGSVEKSNYDLQGGIDNDDNDGGGGEDEDHSMVSAHDDDDSIDSPSEISKGPEKDQESWGHHRHPEQSGPTSPRLDDLRDPSIKESRTMDDLEPKEQYVTSQVQQHEASQVRTTMSRGSTLSNNDDDSNIHQGQLRTNPPPEIVSPSGQSDEVGRTEVFRTRRSNRELEKVEYEKMESSSYADVEINEVSLESEKDDFDSQADRGSSLDSRTVNEISPDSPPNEPTITEGVEMAQSRESVGEHEMKGIQEVETKDGHADEADHERTSSDKEGTGKLMQPKIEMEIGDLEDSERTADHLQESERTASRLQVSEKIAGYDQDKETAAGFTQDNERKTVCVQENERKAVYVQDNERKTVYVQEYERTTTDQMMESERTATDHTQDSERTTDHLQDSQRTTDHLQDSERNMEYRTEGETDGKVEVIGKDERNDDANGDDDDDDDDDDSLDNQGDKISSESHFSEKDAESVEDNGNPTSPEKNGEVTTPMSPQSPENHSEPSNCDTGDDVGMVSKADSDTSESDCRPLSEVNANDDKSVVKTTNGLESDELKDSGLPNHSPEKEKNVTLKVQGAERTNGPSVPQGGELVQADSVEGIGEVRTA
ncbi:uncharacterized protein [Apostichopus japonicus]|uniref:uncharacterized protein isoform X2 n=1 Tax=Stichopus japonicus TaxID=307972 RepID=UPI003AB3C694